MIQLFDLRNFIDDANKYLTNLSTVDRNAKPIKAILTQLKPVMQEEELNKIHDSVKDAVKSSNPAVRPYYQALILLDIQKWLGRVQHNVYDSRRPGLIEALGEIKDPYMSAQKKEKILSDALTTGAPRSQISPKSQAIYAALDKMITKLASLSQPLSVRPDYGTTGDMAERIKEVKKKLEKETIMDAAMIKVIPMQDYDESVAPQPQESPAILDYDDEDIDERPEVIKKGPPCCHACGQPLPATNKVVMGDQLPNCCACGVEETMLLDKVATCMDSTFKKIRELLKSKNIKETQVEAIRKSLDSIYKKYRQLEKEKEEN